MRSTLLNLFSYPSILGLCVWLSQYNSWKTKTNKQKKTIFVFTSNVLFGALLNFFLWLGEINELIVSEMVYKHHKAKTKNVRLSDYICLLHCDARARVWILANWELPRCTSFSLTLFILVLNVLLSCVRLHLSHSHDSSFRKSLRDAVSAVVRTSCMSQQQPCCLFGNN